MSVLKKLGLTKKQLVMITVFTFAAFVGILNQTLLSPALPSIMKELGIDAATAQWLTTAFTMVNAIMIPVTAFLIDRYTTRALFTFSSVVFALGSLMAAVSTNFPLLLGGRILQAMGAGIMMPMLQVVMLIMIKREYRGMVMGVFGLIICFAPMIGPTVAGIIVDQYNWHILFWIIAPLMLLICLLGLATLENVGERKDVSLDKLSVILSTMGFGGLLYGFSAIGSYGIHAIALLVIAVGAVSLVFFFRRQLAIANPMLQVRVLKNRQFLTGTIITMIVQAAMMVASVIVPIYIQTVRGYSATVSGMMMLPGAIVSGIAGLVAGKIFDEKGPRGLAISGAALLCIGSTAFVFLTDSTPIWYLCVMFMVRSLGMSFLNMPLNTWALNALDNNIIAHGTALGNTFRQVSGSLGTAVLITVMSIVSSANADELGANEAMLFGIDVTFGVAAVLSFICLVLSIWKVKDKK